MTKPPNLQPADALSCIFRMIASASFSMQCNDATQDRVGDAGQNESNTKSENRPERTSGEHGS